MADIVLNVTIPNGYKAQVMDALGVIAGKNLVLEASGDDFNSEWHFTISPKGGSETNKEYGERVLRILGKAIINLVDLKEDTDRYNTEINAVDSPASDVPSDILT